jgi:hypothetical protein
MKIPKSEQQIAQQQMCRRYGDLLQRIKNETAIEQKKVALSNFIITFAPIK